MTDTSASRGTLRRGSVAVLAWSLVSIAVALCVLAGVFHLLDRHISTDLTHWWLLNIAQAIGLGLPGGLIASRRPRNPIGWILITVALAQALTVSGREYAVLALAVHHGAWPDGNWGAWLGSWGYVLGGLTSVVMLLFPSGKLRSRRWIPVLLGAAVVLVIGVLGSAFYPGPVLAGPGLVTASNPVGWQWVARWINWIGGTRFTWMVTISTSVCLLGLVARVRGAERALRRQLLVVIIPSTLLSAEFIWEFWRSAQLQPVAGATATTLFSAAVSAAIVRYGLYDLDLAVNRALVYTALSALLLAAYLGTVGVVDVLFGHATVAGALIGAALVALLFAPLRQRLQHAVDRMLYGARHDPYFVMSSLSERMPGAGAILPALAETVARTLKLPYVRIELAKSDAQAAVGTDKHHEPLVIPMIFNGEPVGRLILGRDTRGMTFTADERRLFDDIGRQVAVAAYGVQLAGDLQRSRESLVTAREEERRRIRRDLHDGLGPTLAGIALQLDAARSRLYGDVSGADEVLGSLTLQTQGSIREIRRVVDNLRPAALDELGLGPALRAQAARFPGLSVDVIASGSIDGLPAAVEVAAYRIATEAVTNVARHAAAAHCLVRLELNGSLHVEITDDGHGMPPGWQPGTGITSIRERASELGGTCTLAVATGGGTVVRAQLPVPAA
jgi:signal transduction histidine kinase